MIPLQRGRRSTLWMTPDLELMRLYHDTKRWEGPLRDGRGGRHVAGNPRLDSLLDSSLVFRGAVAEPPPYLRNARSCLAADPTDVDSFAAMCGVKRSTAWCYACQVLEHWPDANVFARKFVYPPLLDAVASAEDATGSLKELMARLEEGPLKGDVDWRCVQDRHAHLRLARLCVVDAPP